MIALPRIEKLIAWIGRTCLASVVVVACAGDPAMDVVPSSAQKPRPTPEPLAVPKVWSELVPQEGPGLYHVKLSWEPGAIWADQWWVLREGPQGRRVVGAFGEAVATYTDSDLQSGTAYTYRLCAVQEGTTVEVGTVPVEVPRDWVVQAGIHAWDPGPFGRVFLQKGAIVRFGSMPVQAQWLELHSEGGVLEAWDEAVSAPAGAPGQPAGNVTLRIGIAVGDFTIRARGQAGGNGRVGRSGGSGERGRSGRSAQWAPALRTSPAAWELERTTAVPGWRQTARVKPGGDGGAGAAGEDGQPGGNGGDGGRVSLTVDQARGFLPVIDVSGGNPGAGGSGGVGGNGGAGGVGSPQGERLPTDWPFPWRPEKAKAGKAGPAGLNGKGGAPGQAGKAGAAYIDVEGTRWRSGP